MWNTKHRPKDCTVPLIIPLSKKGNPKICKSYITVLHIIECERGPKKSIQQHRRNTTQGKTQQLHDMLCIMGCTNNIAEKLPHSNSDTAHFVIFWPEDCSRISKTLSFFVFFNFFVVTAYASLFPTYSVRNGIISD